MRILVITNLFWPDRVGGAAVFTDMCVGLAQRGHEVTVYASHPYYPEWRHKSSASRWAISREHVDGVKVVRHGMYLPRGPLTLRARLLQEASFGLSLMRSALRDRDVEAAIVFCPMPASVAFANVRRKVLGHPVWLNVQDLPAEAASATGLAKTRWVERLASAAQSHLFRPADTWSTISPVMLSRLRTMKHPRTRLLLHPNWLHASLHELIDGAPTRQLPRADRPIRLLYAGNIGRKQALPEFCDVLARSDLSFHLTVYGDGGEASAVSTWMKRRPDDPRFSFGPFLDERGFVAALRECDFFVITERKGAGASFIPSKLIPALAVGTPILGICDTNGPLGVELNEHGLGVQRDWSEVDSALAEVGDLVHDPSGYQQTSKNCLARAAAAYGRQPALERVEMVLREMAASTRGG